MERVTKWVMYKMLIEDNGFAQQRRGPSELEPWKVVMPPPSAAAPGSACLCYSAMTSPPDRVAIARHAACEIELPTNRTDPSMNSVFTPSGW